MLEIITPAPTNDLTTLEVVKEEFGIAADDTSKDGKLRRLIAEASSIVAMYCKREGFGRALYRETFRTGPGSSWYRRGVILTEDVNVQISSVTVDGVPVDPAGYAYDGVLLRRIVGNAATIFLSNFGWSCRALSVTYWAGWDAMAGVPPAVERAALDVIASIYSTPGTRDRSIRSEEVAGVGTITYGTQAAGAALLSPERYPGLDQYQRQILI